MNKVKIGLELHVTLKTQSKLFSAAAQNNFALPNCNTDLIDWGYPGALPQVNYQAVKLGYQLGHLLNCQLSDILKFDRKHYYYFDLPKGFQITQYFYPLAKNGSFKVFLPDNKWITVPIITSHLEEDTAQTLHTEDKLLINYNRAGNSLIEITTAPVFNNFTEIKCFVNQIIRLLKNYRLSDASLTHGSIRIDVNISTLVDVANDVWHPKNEIKNVNNLQNIKKAIAIETETQIFNYHHQKDGFFASWTKNFNEKTQNLEPLRKKFTHYEYMFIPENNIMPIQITNPLQRDWLAEIANYVSEAEFINMYQLNFNEAELIFRHQLQKWVVFLVKHKINLPLIHNFFRQSLLSMIKNFPASTIATPSFHQFALKLLIYYQQKPFSWQIFNHFLNKFAKNSEWDWTTELKNALQPQFLDFAATEKLLLIVVKKFPDLQTRYHKNPQATTNFLYGQIVKQASKPLNPSIVRQLINDYFVD